MAMVKSSIDQPIYLNLISGKSLKIPARSMAEIDEGDLHSPELAYYRGRSELIVLEQPAAAQAPQALQAQPPMMEVKPGQPLMMEVKPGRKGGR